jgi:hypothetical protein
MRSLFPENLAKTETGKKENYKISLKFKNYEKQKLKSLKRMGVSSKSKWDLIGCIYNQT